MTMYILVNFVEKLAVFAALLVFFNFFISTNVVYYLVLVMAALYISQFTYSAVWELLPKRMLPNLNEKAVLVTGCDSGFGHELAKKLDKLGVTVFAGCLFSDGEGASLLKNSCSDRLQVIQLDVTKDDQVREAVQSVKVVLQDRSKKLWAVVNNAGIGQGSEAEWTPLEDYEKTMDVNAMGPIRIVQAFLPLLRETKGRVVFVTSLAGSITLPCMSSYSMSKYAAVSLTDALRRELMKWSISVHNIQPWIYRTNITDPKLNRECAEKLWEKVPQNTRELYGEEHFETFKRSMNNTIGFARSGSAIYEVVDSLVHATVGKNPKVRYIPGILNLVPASTLLMLCDELGDIISYIMNYYAFGKLHLFKEE